MADVEISGDEDAVRRIEKAALFLSDLRPFWPLLVPLATSWWKRQFDTEGAFAGSRWQALSPVTVARKAQLGLRGEILQATGQAKRAASRPTRFATPTTLTLSIGDSGPEHGPVLQFHQDGDGVPKRPLVFGDPLPAVAARELQDVAERYVTDLFGRI